MSRIEYQLTKREELLPEEKLAMFALLARHFDGVTPEQFARDLAEKALALLLRREGEAVGFSTLAAYATEFEGERLNVIYSGDTIVAPEAWGSPALPRAWVSGVEALRETLPRGRCFWLLLSSGFRTYRFLPTFWREFYPRWDAPAPAAAERLMAKIAAERFGAQFDAARGIVCFSNPQRLRAELSSVPPGRELDPHIAFFLQRNPGHAEGDELVCLTEWTPENLTAAGRRIVRSLQHEPAGCDR